MPENTVAKAHRDSSLTSKSKWVTPVIIVLVVGLFIISMVLGAKKTSGGKKWIKPIFEPNSSEVESGLFALQAALGAGIVGYALGRMSGRTKGREEAERASDLNSVDDVPQAAVTSSEDTSTSKS